MHRCGRFQGEEQKKLQCIFVLFYERATELRESVKNVSRKVGLPIAIP